MMTRDERSLLQVISLRPNGAIIRGPKQIRLLKNLCTKGYLQDTYEMADGQFVTRISPAGRTFLASPDTTAQTE